MLVRLKIHVRDKKKLETNKNFVVTLRPSCAHWTLNLGTIFVGFVSIVMMCVCVASTSVTLVHNSTSLLLHHTFTHMHQSTQLEKGNDWLTDRETLSPLVVVLCPNSYSVWRCLCSRLLAVHRTHTHTDVDKNVQTFSFSYLVRKMLRSDQRKMRNVCSTTTIHWIYWQETNHVRQKNCLNHAY